MKKILLFFIALFFTTSAFSQEFKKPSPGKALVYFVRYSVNGQAFNFKYFDGDKYLGKANGRNYFTYECEPGEHLFWVSGNNRDYIKGNLKADATYIVRLRTRDGFFGAIVGLRPVSTSDERMLQRIQRFTSKREEAVLKGQGEIRSIKIERGIERYEKIKDNVKTLDANSTF